MFVKNALELQDASSGITHVDNIEENEVITREEEKTDVKRRRMMWFSCQWHVIRTRKSDSYYIVNLNVVEYLQTSMYDAFQVE